jgi:hypothetical protein
MGWSRRAPLAPGVNCQRGERRIGAPLSHVVAILSVATRGIDIGKNSFHVVDLDQRGAIVVRQRWTRSQIGGDSSPR